MTDYLSNNNFTNLFNNNYQTNPGNNASQSADSFYSMPVTDPSYSAITPELQGVFNSINALMQQTKTNMDQIMQQSGTGTNPTTGQKLDITNPYDQVSMVTESIRKSVGGVNNSFTTMQATSQKAQAAASALHDAVDGGGTEEETIFQILENLSPEEKAATERAYATMYGKGDLSALRKDLRGDLSGADEERAFKALNNGLNKVDSVVAANALKEAMDGWGSDANTVHQIMDNASQTELSSIENNFDQLQGKAGSLRDWIRGDFSGAEEDGLIAKLNQAIFQK